jgi:hypothetical protein
MKIDLKRLIFGAVLAGTTSLASAFPLTAQLTGDPRPDNPDSLIVDVTITQVDSDTVQWLVDINSPAHPDVKLDEFYFNLTGLAADYFFYDFNPADWAVNSPATVQGLGGATFLFEALDPPGPPDAADITNAQSLSFLMDVVSGTLSESLFLNADDTCSNEVATFCGQLGAHLQSLVAGQGESDSGFALGNYVDRPVTIPEPGSLALLGVIGTCLALFSRRREAGSGANG